MRFSFRPASAWCARNFDLPPVQSPIREPIGRQAVTRLASAGRLCLAGLLSGLVGCATTLPEEAPAPGAVVAQAPEASSSAPDGEFPPGTLYRLLTAEFAIRRGEPALAITTYLDVARQTGDPGAAERATRMAIFARNEQAGIDAAKLWVDLADNLEARRVHAVLLVRAGRTEDAVTALKTIINRFTDEEGKGYRLVSDLLSRERNKERRVDLMEKVVAERLDDVHAKTALAQVAARSGQSEKALVLLKEVYDADPSIDRHAAFYASMLRNGGKTEEALKVLADQVERSEDGREVQMLRARFLVDAKRYEEAREQFERLATEYPERSDVRYALGLLLLQTNHHDLARVEFEKLLELGERGLQANYYLGQIAEAQEKPDDAIRFYRRVDRGDQYLNAQVRVAAIFADTGRMDRGRQHLSAIRRDSAQDDIRLYRAEAELLARNDDIEEAIRIYDGALDAHPKNTDLLYARAMMASRIERFEVLENDLRDILSREPNNADALNALGYTLADRAVRVKEAFDLIKRAIALKPKDHHVIDSMGWVLYRMGRLEESVEQLQKAMELKPDVEVAAHLGEVLWVIGRQDEAREIWDTALREKPTDKRLLETINRLSK